MAEKREKEGNFDLGCIFEIKDEVTLNNYALRALAALLRNAPLAAFTEEYYGEGYEDEAASLRVGLSQIIEFCLDRQESIISGVVDQYRQSDIYLLDRATELINMIERGVLGAESAVPRLTETVASLDLIIARKGDQEERASKLKGVCLKHIKQLTGQKKHDEKASRRQ